MKKLMIKESAQTVKEVVEGDCFHIYTKFGKTYFEKQEDGSFFSEFYNNEWEDENGRINEFYFCSIIPVSGNKFEIRVDFITERGESKKLVRETITTSLEESKVRAVEIINNLPDDWTTILDESKSIKEGYRQDSPNNVYEIGDRVAQKWVDEFNVGTVMDIKEEDGIQYLIEWDYADGPDAEWVYGDSISYWIEESVSTEKPNCIKESYTGPKSVEKALYRMYGKPNVVKEAYTRDLKKGDWVEVNLNVKKNGTPNIIPVKVADDLGSEFYGWAWGEGYHKYHKSHMVNKIDMDDMDAIIRKYTPTGYMKDGKDTYNEDNTFQQVRKPTVYDRAASRIVSYVRKNPSCLEDVKDLEDLLDELNIQGVFTIPKMAPGFKCSDPHNVTEQEASKYIKLLISHTNLDNLIQLDLEEPIKRGVTEDCLVGKNLKKGDKITCPDSGEEMEVLDNMGNDGYTCNIKVKYTKTGEEKTHNIGVNSEWKKSVTEDTTPQKRRISYRGYVIRLRKSDEGEQYYDIIKPSWDTREPIWDWCDSVEEAKAWIDSDKDEPFKESKSISEDFRDDWVKTDKNGVVISTNSRGDKLICHKDKGLNADIFNWSVVNKDGSPILSTGKMYYGYDISWTDAETTNRYGSKAVYGDAIILKCIADEFGFKDSDIVAGISGGLQERYEVVCGHSSSKDSGWSVKRVADAIQSAKSENVLSKYLVKPLGESTSGEDWVKSGNAWTKGTKKIIHSVPVRHAEGAIHKYEVLDDGKYIGHSCTLSGAQEIADGKTIKESQNNISAVVSKYNDAFYDEERQIIDCGSEATCKAIAKELGIGPNRTSNSPVAHEIWLDESKPIKESVEYKLKSDYYYDNYENLENCNFDEIIEIFNNEGWIDCSGNMTIPAGTVLTWVGNDHYYDFYEVETSDGVKRIPILNQDNGGDSIADLCESFKPEYFTEDVEPEKIATKADGSFLVRADSGLGYTAYSKDNVCLGGVNTDDEEEAKRKFNYGELDESVLSISDLRRYYETSTSIDREKYPNFPTWYNYMVRSGKYKMEKLVPAAKQIRESVQLTEEEKVLQLAVALLWEMDNFVMSVYDNEGWLMNGPGDGEFDEDTYEEAYNNYEDHTWLITDIDTGLFCASDFADFIDTFESCTSSRRDYDQEERNKIITTAKTLLGHQPTVTEDVEDSDFLEEDDSYWIVYRNEGEVERFYNIDEAYDLYNEIECEIERADEGESVELKEFNEANSYSGETLEFHENDPAGNAADRAYDDYVDRMLFDESLTEEDDADFDEPDTADQQYTSARTSINSAKLPAIFKMVNFEPGTVNLDIGGGKFDNAAEALAQNNVTNLVWDPYNRSNEHNRSVLTQVKKNGGADTVTNSNVLNVIQEPEARLAVIKNCHKYLKNGGTAYFTVYEGSGTGEGGVTKSGYQLNKKTADYVAEIEQVFSNVSRKGKLIVAKK